MEVVVPAQKILMLQLLFVIEWILFIFVFTRFAVEVVVLLYFSSLELVNLLLCF